METISRKSLLYKTNVEYGDYCINHVLGCSHGCLYPCYAFLLSVKGKWLLSGYDNEIYNDRLSGFYKQDFNCFANSLRYRNNKNNCPARTETIWANYDFNEQKQNLLLFEET